MLYVTEMERSLLEQKGVHDNYGKEEMLYLFTCYLVMHSLDDDTSSRS